MNREEVEMGFFSNRRNSIVEGTLMKMVHQGRVTADIPDLYFEAACRYAEDNGGKVYDDTADSVIFDKLIGGENYSIFFMKERRIGGTHIRMTRQPSAFEIMEMEAKECVSNTRDQPEAPPSAPNFPSWAIDKIKARGFVDFVVKRSHAEGVALSFIQEIISDDDLGRMFWAYAAELEFQGNNFDDQKSGVVGLVTSNWEKIDDQHKGRFMAQDAMNMFGS